MKINFNSKIFTKKYREYIANIYSIAIDTIKPACTDLEVNVAFVSKSEIHRLNHEFRGVDRATDVLSFPTLDYVGDNGKIIPARYLTKTNFPADIDMETGNIMLGDIYICLPVCFRQAKEYGTGRKREVSYLALHGLLHLLGYDHIEDADKKKMRAMEDKIINQMK